MAELQTTLIDWHIRKTVVSGTLKGFTHETKIVRCSPSLGAPFMVGQVVQTMGGAFRVDAIRSVPHWDL